ncbi:MAG: transposase, partial [Deltaproteobacteria bacterium CG_4_9_14_3_um_filter_51_14]
VILEIFEKKTNRTPKSVTDVCKKRIKDYEL